MRVKTQWRRGADTNRRLILLAVMAALAILSMWGLG